MRAHPASLVLVLLFLGLSSGSMAQSADRSSLMSDLCGCMSAIDLRENDSRVEGAVRDCLESAVLYHPAEVYAVLQHTPVGGSKAFRLGTALGGNLLRVCEPFRAVKARLQQMPPKVQGT